MANGCIKLLARQEQHPTPPTTIPALEGEGDVLAETAALEDAAERLVLDGCEKVVAGVESMSVEKVTLIDEEVADADETVPSVEDMDIGIVAVVVGRVQGGRTAWCPNTVVDVASSLVEMGSMVYVWAATRAMGTSNTGLDSFMVANGELALICITGHRSCRSHNGTSYLGYVRRLRFLMHLQEMTGSVGTRQGYLDFTLPVLAILIAIWMYLSVDETLEC
ncbi:hypothetical protein EDD18DRAFT_1410460 [Armillaria luteobubalina]|uniref:Uncharacterized protein n=1 Tax=Armillaria luteobubalina TaxID=153913 RepID=A0AA39PXV6_9AGAR|nr:hypothetical protein EDD18DRAFT_1410460 [Armillaria luteobubalina]